MIDISKETLERLEKIAISRGKTASELIETWVDRLSQQEIPPNELLDIPLTLGELKVVRLVSLGWGNKDIASELHIGSRTVESHISRILCKTSAENRTMIARWALDVGIA